MYSTGQQEEMEGFTPRSSSSGFAELLLNITEGLEHIGGLVRQLQETHDQELSSSRSPSSMVKLQSLPRPPSTDASVAKSGRNSGPRFLNHIMCTPREQRKPIDEPLSYVELESTKSFDIFPVETSISDAHRSNDGLGVQGYASEPAGQAVQLSGRDAIQTYSSEPQQRTSINKMGTKSVSNVSSSVMEMSRGSRSSNVGFSLHEAWTSVDDQVIAKYLEARQERLAEERRGSKEKNLMLDRTMLTKQSWGHRLIRAKTHLGSSGEFVSKIKERWIIHPLSHNRLLWDFLCILCLVYDVVTVPIQVFPVPDSVALDVLEGFCILFWALDIVMSFRTGYMSHSNASVELNPRKVAKHYVLTWLSLDIIILLAQATVFVRDSNVFFDVTQILRLFRLVKLWRLNKVFEERSNQNNRVTLYVNFMKVLGEFAIAVHLISCGWYLLGKSQQRGWTQVEEHMQGAEFFYCYFASSRWTIAQISGRTDLELRTASEYVYTVFACVCGFIGFSVIISSVTNTMIELGALTKERTSRTRLLNSYLRRHTVPINLAESARAHLAESARTSREFSEEQELLVLLPKQMLLDLLYEVRTRHLIVHQFFFDVNHEFPRTMRRICGDSVKHVLVREDEEIFARGDACSRMLFVEKGLLSYDELKSCNSRKQTISGGGRRPSITQLMPFGMRQSPSGSEGHSPMSPTGSGAQWSTRTITEGEWLCEPALWVEWENRGTLTAVDNGTLFAIEVTDFIETMKLFKDARARAALYARAFVNRLAFSRLTDIMDAVKSYMNFDDD